MLPLALLLIQATNNSGGPQQGKTGAPGEGACSQIGCHTSSILRIKDSSTTFTFSPALVNNTYQPGTTYDVAITIAYNQRSKFGFQATVLNSNNTKGGDLAKASATDNTTSLVIGSGTFANRQYIQHTNNGNTGTNSRTWSFKWTAPAAGTGAVTFFTAMLAADGDGQSDGQDSTYRSRYTIGEAVASSVDPNLGNQIGFRAYPNPANDYLNLDFKLEKAQDVQITMLNLAGQVVRTQTLEAIAGQQTHRLEVSGMNTGVYLLQVSVAGRSLTQKVIIN
jgi:hypothetical protein